MRRIALLVPGPFTTLSGGYEYDRRIVQGLRAMGAVVDVIEVAADPHAAWQAVDASALPVIDGLALPLLAPLQDALVMRGAVALVHHPMALETGLDSQARARLHDFEQTVLPRIARIIVTSDMTRDTLVRDFAIDAARVRVVVPGTEAAPRSRGSNGPCHLLAIGTLIPRKGHDVLLRALARLFDLDWRLTIVGSATSDPAHAQTLTSLADTLGIAERVVFAGAADAAKLAELWNEADIFALATYYEGYGMAVAEALKHGLPVAVCGGGGGAAGALVTQESGVVCPPGDHDHLSKALRRLIFDKTLRAQMAEAAWNVGRSLPSWEAQVLLFAQALEKDGAG
jgi:glycosyltransferase involved in cell wall biosynthesis